MFAATFFDNSKGNKVFFLNKKGVFVYIKFHLWIFSINLPNKM